MSICLSQIFLYFSKKWSPVLSHVCNCLNMFNSFQIFTGTSIDFQQSIFVHFEWHKIPLFPKILEKEGSTGLWWTSREGFFSSKQFIYWRKGGLSHHQSFFTWRGSLDNFLKNIADRRKICRFCSSKNFIIRLKFLSISRQRGVEEKRGGQGWNNVCGLIKIFQNNFCSNTCRCCCCCCCWCCRSQCDPSLRWRKSPCGWRHQRQESVHEVVDRRRKEHIWALSTNAHKTNFFLSCVWGLKKERRRERERERERSTQQLLLL